MADGFATTISRNRLAAYFGDRSLLVKTKHVDSLQQVANMRGELGMMYRGMVLYLSPAATGRSGSRAAATWNRPTRTWTPPSTRTRPSRRCRPSG